MYLTRTFLDPASQQVRADIKSPESLHRRDVPQNREKWLYSERSTHFASLGHPYREEACT